jgi:hypothetical protein
MRSMSDRPMSGAVIAAAAAALDVVETFGFALDTTGYCWKTGVDREENDFGL